MKFFFQCTFLDALQEERIILHILFLNNDMEWNGNVFILPFYYAFQRKVLQISQHILQLISQMA